MFEYFVQVVPTEYEYGWWGRIHTNQFSVTEYEHKILTYDNSGVPGFFIMYELSPIMVEYSESSRSFLHFLVNLCAIVGGVYTVASLIDSFIYNITVKYFR
uniref:Endoplasmic reticulum vesicle transporter C-terminal domain-containing protein n=1 Tax=Arcella intermedia TaxID=1963864 RepID=A0A6B2LSY9_9EUKA